MNQKVKRGLAIEDDARVRPQLAACDFIALKSNGMGFQSSACALLLRSALGCQESYATVRLRVAQFLASHKLFVAVFNGP
jgi:hypothetical protein